MTDWYAGIGAQATPAPILATMREVGAALGRLGWGLRSGHAPGADTAFEFGAEHVGAPREIFLPWRGFNGSQSTLWPPTEGAYHLAMRFHPTWLRLKPAATKLIARNGHQVLGRSLDSPVRWVICWTEGGKDVGGTSQAIRIARHHAIPIVNLGARMWRDAIADDVVRFVADQAPAGGPG